MNRVFADTSAFLALLVAGDESHGAAKRAFASLKDRRATLLSTSYVLVETYALCERRLGLESVRSFREAFEPLLETRWVDEPLHERGLELLLAKKKRGLSLVDAVSFVAAREAGVGEVFAFDRHFVEEGFSPVG
jgi:predicted nucleic acid-binding protein